MQKEGMRCIVKGFSIAWQTIFYGLRIARNPPLEPTSLLFTDKDELVKLLSYLLKTCVREESYIDKNHEIQTRWVVEYKNKLTPDEVLDKIDKRHWRTHPEESYYTWWHRSEYWWDHHHFLW